MTKLKNSNCEKTKKLKLWQNSISNRDQTQKLKIVTKINSNCDKTQKLKLWQNLTVVIVKFFSKKNFITLTTNEMFEGQRFAILAIFLKTFILVCVPSTSRFQSYLPGWKSVSKSIGAQLTLGQVATFTAV